MSFVSCHRRSGGTARLLIAAALLVAGATSVNAATASWTPETLLAADFAFSETATRINAAVNPSGKSVIAWDKPLPASGLSFSGPHEVYATVRGTTTSNWSAPVLLSLSGVSATNAGATVDPGTGKVTVAWTSAGVPSVSSSSDGVTWSTTAVPVPAGYDYLPVGNLVDTDSKGNITLALGRLRPADSRYDVIAIVRTSTGTWRTPVTVSGSGGLALATTPRLNVISDGRALLSFGTTTVRRSSNGTWSAPQAVSVTGFGIVDIANADIDANGKGYLVMHTVTSGVPAVYVSTSAQTGAWSAPAHAAALDTIYGALQITGSSSGRALISGADSSGQVRVSATADGGSTWQAPVNLGVGFMPEASGSESGLYAVTWTGAGTGSYSAWVASGSGIGTAAWTQSAVGTRTRMGSPAIAIAGKSGSTTARAIAGWEREGDTVTPNNGLGAATASLVR